MRKLPLRAKIIFSENIGDILCEILDEVINGKRNLQELIDANFFDFIFCLDRPVLETS